MKFKLRDFLTNIYAFGFFNSLIFLYPVYAIFFADNGLSDIQISVLFIIWSLATMAFQVPVNIFASIFKPKQMVIFCQFMKLSAFVLWFMWPTFYGFALGFILWGIQWANWDSVTEGMIYDELKELRSKKAYVKISGRRSFVDMIAILIGASGSLLLAFGYGIIFALSIISLLVSIFFLWRTKLTKNIPHNIGVGLAKRLSVGTRVLRASPYVLKMFILACVLNAVYVIDDYMGLIGIELGMPVIYIGAIFFMTQAAQNLGSVFAYKFEHIKNSALYYGSIGLGLILALFYFTFNLPAILLLGLFFLVCGALYTIAFGRMQHAISSGCRTMVLGMNSVLTQVVCIFVYVLVGIGLAFGGFNYSMLLVGALCAAVGIWALLFLKKYSVKANSADDCINYKQIKK